MGFAFKANTDDTRERPGIFIAKRLIEERAELIIADPKILNNVMIYLEGIEGKITYAENPYEFSAGCHAIAFMKG